MIMDHYSGFYRGTGRAAGSAAIHFLEGTGPDSSGRTLENVLSFSDAELERHHDYIQWLFPLDVGSQAVPNSPILSAQDVSAIRQSPHAQQSLRAAATRMESFYSDNDHWLRTMDHNHLRITRIIKSLRMLTDDETANQFRREITNLVERAGTPVNSASLRFWAKA